MGGISSGGSATSDASQPTLDAQTPAILKIGERLLVLLVRERRSALSKVPERQLPVVTLLHWMQSTPREISLFFFLSPRRKSCGLITSPFFSDWVVKKSLIFISSVTSFVRGTSVPRS